MCSLCVKPVRVNAGVYEWSHTPSIAFRHLRKDVVNQRLAGLRLYHECQCSSSRSSSAPCVCICVSVGPSTGTVNNGLRDRIAKAASCVAIRSFDDCHKRREREREREIRIRIRMIYSFRPLTLMKGCGWMTRLPPQSQYIL